MSVDYRCKSCGGVVPRGHRMQQCGCGKVMVDWGAGGKSSTIRVLWPGGNPDDWIETIDEMMVPEINPSNK